MNTFIFLGCVPVPGWQHKIDFVTKLYLTKKVLIFWYEKKQKNFLFKGCHWGFSEEILGEFAVNVFFFKV